MFGLFEGFPEGERAYRLKADWLTAKLQYKKKRIGRMAEADEEFREKLISNPEAALLYAGVDTKGIPVSVQFYKNGGVGTILELSFAGRRQLSQKERSKESYAFGILPSATVTVVLPFTIELPRITSSLQYASDLQGRLKYAEKLRRKETNEVET
jgi:hypothetical protein